MRQVHGYAKQGAAFGYTGVRGLNLQLSTISTPIAAPVIARAGLRQGNTASATGARRMLAQTITTAQAAGVTGQVLCRADPGFYGWAFVGTAIRHKAWFSVTARMNPAVTRAIASIDEDAWQAIEYPNAVYDEPRTVGCLILRSPRSTSLRSPGAHGVGASGMNHALPQRRPNEASCSRPKSARARTYPISLTAFFCPTTIAR